MSLKPLKSPIPSNVSNNNTQDSTLKRVYDIILSPDHPRYGGPSTIGLIFFGDLKKDDTPITPYTLPTAKPKNLNNFQCPAIGDIVEVIRASHGDDYYPEMGGDTGITGYYYSPSINIHSSIINNALPSAKIPKPEGSLSNEYDYNLLEGGENISSFQKEFTAPNREIVLNKIDNYLIGLGYPQGRLTPNAPKYSEWKRGDNSITYKIDNVKYEPHKLGEYFKDNPNVSSLLPMEGDILQQGRSGQSIRFSSTTPSGKNPWSAQATERDDDGNPNVGEPLMILRVADPKITNGAVEDINKDASSIYLASNQSIINFIPADDNIDSLKSKYTPIRTSLESIETLPPSPIPNTPTPILQPTSSFLEIVIDPLPEPPTPVYNEDPVFDALDVARDEELLTYIEYGTEDSDSGVYDDEIYGEVLPPLEEYDPTLVGSTPPPILGNVNGGGVIPNIYFDSIPWANSPNDVIIKDIDRTKLVYPMTNGRFGSRASTWGSSDLNSPYKREPYRRYPEFGTFRGYRSDGSPRFHNGIDLNSVESIPKNDFQAIYKLPLLRAIGNSTIIYISTDSGGFRCKSVFAEGGNNADCGGRYGNYVAYQLNDYPNYAVAYAHCFTNSIQINPRTGKKFKVGDNILKGEPLAVMGSSGNSSGWHLHMEIIDINKYASRILNEKKAYRGWLMGKNIKRYDPQSLWPEFKLGFYW